MTEHYKTYINQPNGKGVILPANNKLYENYYKYQRTNLTRI